MQVRASAAVLTARRVSLLLRAVQLTLRLAVRGLSLSLSLYIYICIYIYIYREREVKPAHSQPQGELRSAQQHTHTPCREHGGRRSHLHFVKLSRAQPATVGGAARSVHSRAVLKARRRVPRTCVTYI